MDPLPPPALGGAPDRVPTLRICVEALDRLTASEGAGAQEVSRLVANDPAMAARVLRVANCPLYGRGEAVGSVDAAIQMLSLPAVIRLAQTVAAYEADGRPPAMENARRLEHAVASAAGCRALAERLGSVRPDEAWTAGLLHSLGQAMLEGLAPQRYAEASRRAGAGGRALVEMEREALGTDHARLGGLLAERWNWPPALRQVMALHHDPADARASLPVQARALLEIVVVVDSLLAAQGIAGCGVQPEALEVGGTPLSPDDAAAAVQGAMQGLRAAASGLSLPDGPPEAFAERLRAAAVSRATATTGVLSVPDRPPIVAALGTVAAALRTLRSLPSADEAWEQGLRGLRSGLGADRAIFFAYDAERARLDFRQGVDDTGLMKSAERRGNDLPVAGGGAMARAIRDGNPMPIEDGGADAEFLRCLGVARAVVCPVDVLERTHGVVVADNLFTQREFSPEEVALLGILSGELGLAMENLLLHRQSAKLRSLAEKDELTGINNRRNLMTLFQRELDRARRYGSLLSVAMVDIDFFKSFNDSYGHQAGDDVLRTIAQVMVSASREIDIIGRYGGEEFMAVLPETALAQASIYGERLRARVEACGRDLRTRFPKAPALTISVGISQAQPSSGDDVEKIVSRVDAALYMAKERGRNQVVVSDA